MNEVYAAGDGDHGVQTAAYNLPNDERVITQKGSKRVMLKNVQEAKFEATLMPISKRVLAAAGAGTDLSFDAFFTHILAHELSHGIGPHQITGERARDHAAAGDEGAVQRDRRSQSRCHGLFMLQYMYDHRMLPNAHGSETQLYTTFLASAFRSLRFGLKEAHGKGMALQFNYLMDKGAVTSNADGTFAVNMGKIKGGVRDLDHDLLTLEATGDYAGAKRMLRQLGVIRPVLQKAFDRLAEIPVDIEPVF